MQRAGFSDLVRILIFGAGAIGGFFGALLSRSHDVTLVVRPQVAKAVEASGLRVEGLTRLKVRPRVVGKVDPLLRPQLVMITTKAYDTASAMKALAPLHATATFLTLQNGLGNAEIVTSSATRVMAGTTSHGVTLLHPGHLRHAGKGETVVGAVSGVPQAEVAAVAEAFDAAGIPTRTTPHVLEELWRKVVLNSAINPVAALVRGPNGLLLKEPELERLAVSVLKESCAVATLSGFPLDLAETEALWRRLVEETASNRNSMLQDLEAGRPTEVEAITGAIVRGAEAHGVAVPLNRALLILVRASSLRQGTKRPSPPL